MSKRKVHCLVWIMTLLLSGVTWAKEVDDPIEWDGIDIEVPEGYVLVEEYVLMFLVEAPGEHFQKANDHFLKKEYEEAAEEIRKGQAYLKLQTGRATKAGRRHLRLAIKALDNLATAVEKGSINSVSRLEKTFAQAHHALARHHQLKAEAYDRQHAREKLSHALKASAYHLEKSTKWTGQKAGEGTMGVIKSARFVAGKLVGGVGWISEETGKAVGGLGEEIGKLGRKILPAKSPKR